MSRLKYFKFTGFQSRHQHINGPIIGGRCLESLSRTKSSQVRRRTAHNVITVTERGERLLFFLIKLWICLTVGEVSDLGSGGYGFDPLWLISQIF